MNKNLYHCQKLIQSNKTCTRLHHVKKKKIENKQEINKKRSKIKTKMSNKKTPNNELFPSLLRVIDLTFFYFCFFYYYFGLLNQQTLGIKHT